MNDLLFKIEDFGPIHKLNMNLSKINVIAGINGSGKSTASKILYSFLISISPEGINFYNDNLTDYYRNIRSHLWRFDENKQYSELQDILRKTFDKIEIDDEESSKSIFKKLLEVNSEEIKSENFENLIKSSEKYFELKKSPAKRRSEIFKQMISLEFEDNTSFRNYHSKLNLSTNDNSLDFSVNFPFEESSITFHKEKFSINDVFYIETPYIFDLENKRAVGLKKYNTNQNWLYHQKSLLNRLYSTIDHQEFDAMQTKLLSPGEHMELIDKMIDGGFDINKISKQITYKTSDGEYLIRNTASGIKTIGILKTLLNSKIDTNSFLILDEPEVHLHPEWQLEIAKIIVLLARDKKIHFYINSHSPQFIEAIEVFSEYYGIADETNFYLSTLDENVNKYVFNNVERQEISTIYKNLGNPYNILNEFRGKNLSKHM
ncbi:AAA family ATPase [Methanobrevibacter curvatus]|uniref:Endonuclease GajA/Old nuclease/RecF-like AAA domain-containing protein n=1 Tax=Methanobrevibacter curvatus TaxID=49547 RepID=A0A166AV52_9EURY|nr:AAA family ATPase [Methanobrevibacter curvatus]KZX12508.1 hypothetical protein MBCUR_10450 [Methanobrevibacter curvatus]